MATVELDIITLAEDQFLRRSLFLAGFVVVCYDHLLTLRLEVTHIWTPTFKRSSAWFLFFRYMVLVSNFTMIPYFLGDLSPETCKRLSVADTYLLLIQEFCIGCILALRVCAMYGFNKRVFAACSIAALTTLSLGAWSTVPVGPEVIIKSDFPGCHITIVKAQAIRYAAAWEALLICDIVILGFTLRRAYTYHRSVGSGLLLSTMVRDGAVYFGMICSVNLANIVMQYSGDILTADSLAWFASAISATMVSRLMLNLHDAAYGNSAEATLATDQGLESIRFWRAERTRESARIFTSADGHESRI